VLGRNRCGLCGEKGAAQGTQGHAGRMATRQGKLHKLTRDVGSTEAHAIDARPGCAREAPQMRPWGLRTREGHGHRQL